MTQTDSASTSNPDGSADIADSAASADGADSDASADSGSTSDPAAATPADQKAAFKAALDRKNAASNARSQHLEGDNKVAGNSHAAATKRVFRRKSG